jgi:hypothetical protein
MPKKFSNHFHVLVHEAQKCLSLRPGNHQGALIVPKRSDRLSLLSKVPVFENFHARDITGPILAVQASLRKKRKRDFALTELYSLWPK